MQLLDAILKKVNPSELEIGVSDRVLNIKKFKSPFGESVLVELEECVLILPKRIVQQLNKIVIDELTGGDGCCIKYIGQNNPFMAFNHPATYKFCF